MSGVRSVKVGGSPHAAAVCHGNVNYIPAYGITPQQVHDSIMPMLIRKRARSLATRPIGKRGHLGKWGLGYTILKLSSPKNKTMRARQSVFHSGNGESPEANSYGLWLLASVVPRQVIGLVQRLSPSNLEVSGSMWTSGQGLNNSVIKENDSDIGHRLLEGGLEVQREKPLFLVSPTSRYNYTGEKDGYWGRTPQALPKRPLKRITGLSCRVCFMTGIIIPSHRLKVTSKSIYPDRVIFG